MNLLSIQSHVAHGYVGGRAAIFPLQCQGWNVDCINTVEFSNHTGYGFFHGDPIEEKALTTLLDGVECFDYTYILSGYIPDAKLIHIVHNFVRKYKVVNPHTIYILDPVLGDNGHLYVDRSCINTYRDMFHEGLVDVCTPNQFELELLVEHKVDSNETLDAALKNLLAHVRFVVVTSLITKGGDLVCVCATHAGNAMFRIERIDSYFTGVGDLFSSLLASKIYKNSGVGNDLEILETSVNQVLTIMGKTLRRTRDMSMSDYKRAYPDSEGGGSINDSKMKYFELRVVESRKDFGCENADFTKEQVDIEK